MAIKATPSLIVRTRKGIMPQTQSQPTPNSHLDETAVIQPKQQFSLASTKATVGQAGYQKGFTTLDHILTLRALIEEVRAHNKILEDILLLVDFRRAFDIVSHARFMQ